MQQMYNWDKKSWYYYESWVNDKTWRDIKYKQLKAAWYKSITVWDYVCATWETIYFITWK